MYVTARADKMYSWQNRSGSNNSRTLNMIILYYAHTHTWINNIAYVLPLKNGPLSILLINTAF